MKDIFHEFGRASSQVVNFNKSTDFCSSNMSEEVKKYIASILGVQFSFNLEKYLGLPKVVGRRKNAYFQFIKDKTKMCVLIVRARRCYLKVGRRYSLSQSYSRFLPTQCYVSFFRNFFFMS